MATRVLDSPTTVRELAIGAMVLVAFDVAGVRVAEGQGRELQAYFTRALVSQLSVGRRNQLVSPSELRDNARGQRGRPDVAYEDVVGWTWVRLPNDDAARQLRVTR